MAAITLVNSGSFVLYTDSNGYSIYLPKQNLEIEFSGSSVTLIDFKKTAYTFAYTAVGAPSSSSAADLASQIAAYITAEGGTYTMTTTQLPATLGQKAMAASLAVVIASDQSAIPVSTTAIVPGVAPTNLGKAEDAAAVDGDTGVMILAKRVDTAATQTTTDGDYTTPVANSLGAQRVVINRTFQVSDANDLLKAEDAAHVSGDAGVMGLAVSNEAQVTFGADGDYTPVGTDRKGNTYVTGQDVDNAPQTNTKPVSVGGKAVENTTYAPAYTAGDEAQLAFDLTTGRALVQGNVGGFTNLVQSTVVMSVAGAYATGDYMGTTTSPQSFASAVRTTGGTGVIKSLVISDKITTANVAMELWIFDRTFVAPTDNAAWAISDAEALTVQAVIPISTAGWYASSNNQVYVDGTLSIPIKSNGTTLFYALVARGTTPSFTSSDLTIVLGILQD